MSRTFSITRSTSTETMLSAATTMMSPIATLIASFSSRSAEKNVRFIRTRSLT